MIAGGDPLGRSPTPPKTHSWAGVHGNAHYRAVCAAAVERLGVASGDRVLDVGAGTGIIAELIAERGVRDVSVLSVDPDPATVALLREDGYSTAALLGGFDDLPRLVPPGTVDRIVAANSIHLAGDLCAAVDNMAGCLRAGGRFVALTGYYDGAIAPEDALGYALGLRAAVKVVGRHLGGSSGVRVRTDARDRVQISRDALRAGLNEAGLTGIREEIVPLSMDRELTRAIVTSEMFASGLFEGVDDQTARIALAAGVDRVMGDGMVFVRRMLLVTAVRRNGLECPDA